MRIIGSQPFLIVRNIQGYSRTIPRTQKRSIVNSCLSSHRACVPCHSPIGLTNMHTSAGNTETARLEQQLLATRNTSSRDRNDRRSLRNLYRAIQIQLQAWPDSHCSDILRRFFRTKFRQSPSKSSDPHRDKVNARKWLIVLQKANVGDLKAITKVIETAYGQRGSIRHDYMKPILDQVTVPMDQLIPGYSRSRPPATPERLAALWALQFPRNKIEVVLPLGPGGELGKPLDRRRQANIRWRHHTALLEKTMPPIPADDLDALRSVATGNKNLCHGGVPRWRRSTQKEMMERAERKTTQPHTINARLLRRLYLPVLARSPVLYRSVTGKWAARYDQTGQSVPRNVKLNVHEFVVREDEGVSGE